MGNAAEAFSSFYRGYPVLTEENPERKTFLLWLAQYCGLQMEKILGVLGIDAPVYM